MRQRQQRMAQWSRGRDRAGVSFALVPTCTRLPEESGAMQAGANSQQGVAERWMQGVGYGAVLLMCTHFQPHVSFSTQPSLSGDDLRCRRLVGGVSDSILVSVWDYACAHIMMNSCSSYSLAQATGLGE